MKRLLGLLSVFGFCLALVGACSQQPVVNPGDDDDDDENGPSCAQGTWPCGNQCLNLAGDPLNCGECGRQCSAGQICWGGECQCDAGFTSCGTGCTNPQSDPNNCGGCNIVCPATAPFCSTGSCSASCGAGLSPCGQQCVALASDRFNCGACGVACSGGQACSGGACACPGGQELCGTACVPLGACGGGGGMGGSGAAGSGAGGGGAGLSGAGGAGSGGAAGSGTSGSANGGGGGVVTGAPPGYWTHDSWQGCTWTGIDTVSGTTTTNMPRDFTMHSGGSYCVSGSVHSDYESVALLGFNLNEAATSSATQCAYNPANATAMGPPGVTLSGTGIAVNFSKSTAATLRIQIQGPNAATDPEQRWCYTITPAAGPIFAPFSSFNTQCWDNMGTAYSGQPISAIVFLVPGTMGAATPFEYCINGFATGTQASDAPTWGDGGGGPLMGTIGGPGGENLDFQRVKVSKDGKSYIIQNNNWGNPGGSDQTLRYSDNSFTVVSSTGSGSSAPASFPSIFIGANGDTQNGTYTTRSDDGLPKQISAIGTLMSTFRHTGTSGQLNATYDIWFSDHTPTGARYDDAISGFVMLWLYDPPNFQPIGSQVRTANIGGMGWNVWVGPRGATGAMCEGVQCSANRPVVSYVAQQTSGTFTGDLKPFFVDAAQNGIPANWYLTDVFAGFECWSGSDCVNKAVQEFTAVVQ